MTAAFRRYVERVQSVAEATPRTDLQAALRLAEEIGGHGGGAVDPPAIAVHAPAIRQLARGVRHAGRGAVGHPALLARAIVVARMLASASADAPVDGSDPRALAGAAR